MKARWLLAILGFALLIGCGDNGSAKVTDTRVTTDTTLPKGWVRVVSKADGLSIGVAPGWTAQDFTSGQLAAESKKVTSDESNAMSASQQNGWIKIAVLGMAIGPYRPNLNVLAIPVPTNATTEQAATEGLRELLKNGRAVDSSTVQTSSGPAILQRYNYNVDGPGTTLTVTAHSFTLVKGHTAYLISGTALADSKASLADVDAMAKTIKVP